MSAVRRAVRRAVRPSKRRAKGNRHLSLSARDSEWAVVGRNAARLGLSKARYLVGLVERDAAGEEDKGPFMALSPDEQRALLAAVRAIHALITEDAPGEEDPARQSGAASPAREPAAAAPEPGRPAYAADPHPDSMAPDVADPETGDEAGLPDGPDPEEPGSRQGRLAL